MSKVTLVIDGERRQVSNPQAVITALDNGDKWIAVYVHSADGKTPNAACHQVPSGATYSACFTGGHRYKLDIKRYE